MKVLFLTLLLSAPAFAIEPSAFKNGLERLHSEQKEKIQQCNNQNESVIKKGYKEILNPPDPNEIMAFVEDEKQALEIINKVDLNKIFEPSEAEADNYLLKNCNKNNGDIYEELNKNRPICLNTSTELDFMRALIAATKNYSWSIETKDKAKKLVLGYVQFGANSPNRPLLSNMTIGSLLYRMGDYNLIPKELAAEAKHANDEADKSLLKIASLRDKGQKITSKASCIHFINYRKAQLEISNDLARKLQGILKRVN